MIILFDTQGTSLYKIKEALMKDVDHVEGSFSLGTAVFMDGSTSGFYDFPTGMCYNDADDLIRKVTMELSNQDAP